MSEDLELQNIIRSILDKSLQILNQLEFKSDAFVAFLEKWMDVISDCHDFFVAIMQNPQLLVDRHDAYLKDAFGLFQDQWSHWIGNTPLPPTNDKRFSEDIWVQHPFFLMISQQYLLAKAHLHVFLEQVDYVDPHLLKRFRFIGHQIIDALSPEHFLCTNPQLLVETIQSHGKNLLRGFNHFLTDIDTGSVRLIMSMTDKSAFSVGKNIAITPGKVVFKNELIELIQYSPQTVSVKSVPLLIIPPWINKYYILDLSPDNSLVRWLVSQGIVVYIISWRNPDKNDAHFGLEAYLTLGPMAAIDAIKTQLTVKKISVLGFCIGGTLLAMLLAYYKARQINVIKSATFLASLLDFSDPGDIGVYLDEKQILAIEKRMKKQGYFEGELMAAAFNSLRAKELIWAFFIRNYLHGQPPVPFDLLFWNMDTTNMPEKMHSEYLRWMYLHNDLIKPGKIIINGTPIDVRAIDVPVFFLSTKKDHIAPWQSTYKGFVLMGGKKRFVLGGSGHIAGIVIPPGKEKYGYYTNSAQPDDPEAWLIEARYHSGSWWPEWLKWLKRHSGGTVPAPEFSQLPLQPIVEAPGTYVL